MNIFMTNYGLIFLVAGAFISMIFVFISLMRETISPDYQKKTLILAKELDEIEKRTRGEARRRLQRQINKRGF